MSRFKFRLEKVLRVRQAEEERVKVALAPLARAYETTRRELKVLVQNQTELRRTTVSLEGAKRELLVQLECFKESLQEKLKKKAQALAEKQRQVMEKRKKRRVLELLKEKAEREWKKQNKKQGQRSLMEAHQLLARR